MERTVQLTAFAILMGTCLAGMAHASPWAISVGGCLLALVGLGRGRMVRAASAEADVPFLEAASVIVSLGNAAVAAGGSYVLGHTVRWMWGV